MKRIFLINTRLVTILLFVSFLFQQNLTAQVSKLKVIPEVQQFTASSGTTSMSRKVKILVETVHSDSLMPIALQLKDELKTMMNITATVSPTTASTAQKNEVLLMYSKTQLKNYEAYNMTIGEGIVISGASRQGTFWGTRTLLQLIENHKNIIPCGFVYDYPNYPNRGFMLDTGRKFFTIDFLRHYVKLLSYYKMNEFQIHLNDNGFKKYFNDDWMQTYAAFRLESESFPGLTAKDGHYTKAEFRNLQLLGMRYGVNVIPEIDAPAHALAFTQYNPNLAASNKAYGMDHLDLYKPEVYEFLDKLYAEYTTGPNPCFVGPDLHIGTDEYNRDESKKFREFTNRYMSYITQLGKRPRLWGGMRWMNTDTTSVKAQGNAIINAWSRDWVDPYKSLEDGFKLINTCDAMLYIVPAAGYYYDFLNNEWLYNNYRPEKINHNETLPDYTPGVLGGMFAVWNDICGNGISHQDVHYRVYSSLKVMGNKLWKVMPERSYNDFKKLADSTSEGHGLNYSGVYSPEQLKAITSKLGRKAVKFNGNTSLNLGGSDFGYNYDASFDIKPEPNNKPDAVIFQSSFSKITLNTNGTGKLGFSRDGYVYTFNYIPKNDWQQIRILGDFNSVTLYVDSIRIERLAPYNKNGFNFQQTLFFPLQTAGDKENGLKGQLKNLNIQYQDLSKIKSAFVASKTTLTTGRYYIKYGEKYLTNTKPNGKGGEPEFLAKNSDPDMLAVQQWDITLVSSTNRYKIASATDQRYLNEICAFGTNPYNENWNTYNFFKKNNLYAIQNDGNGGTGFWFIDNNRFYTGSESYDDSNYVVEFVPIKA